MVVATESIIRTREPSWMLTVHLLDSLMHTIGQLHSNGVRFFLNRLISHSVHGVIDRNFS